MTTVNGFSLSRLFTSTPEINSETQFNDKTKKDVIAKVFFRFSHRDKDGMLIHHKLQKKVTKNIEEKLKEFENKNESGFSISRTIVPYFDTVVNYEDRDSI